MKSHITEMPPSRCTAQQPGLGFGLGEFGQPDRQPAGLFAPAGTV